jgi:hypothetical protein
MTAFHAMNVLFVGWLGLYRGELYSFPSSAWALAASVGVLGLAAPVAFPAPVRVRLLAGMWPLVLAVPILLLLVSPRLVPSPLSVGPFFFCAGASLSTCLLVGWNMSRRRRALRRLLEPPASPDDGRLPDRLEAYLEAQAEVIAEGGGWMRRLRRALRAQAWIPSQDRRARAAAVLRDYAAFVDRGHASLASVPLPVEALHVSEPPGDESWQRLSDGFRTVAAQLERGKRLFRWRSWLVGLAHADLDGDRNLIYALEVLARREQVALPPAFRAFRRGLASSPLTPLDITPPWNGASRVARPVAVGAALVTALSALVGTATAQKRSFPPDDGRPLPVVAGPSDESRVEPRLSRAVATLAGRPAEVRCWSEEDWTAISDAWARSRAALRLGPWSAYTSYDPERVHLPPAICDSLVRLAYTKASVADDEWAAGLAWSVAALAHETQHVSGTKNEAAAECYAIQAMSSTAEALGRPDHEGRYLTQLYWTHAYSERSDPVYSSPDCRDGGRLDLDPSSDDWP